MITSFLTTTINKTIQLQDLGLRDYKETWEIQEKISKGIVNSKVKILKHFAQLFEATFEKFVI